ncbi:ExbD/TolR family protein [Marinobacterium lutimaris]|uniref:Outer membrane transport energization protein ExbD n=1 Tax=Marinobacterium lutimaris TaxID=568106 RepID=A0A1H5THZ5_9GAMM|nr:biopolymer transporter ExbD [Marinobacterium lutimaris]SEF62429.1 outer membrane transport energization protein ExbD [Marinobacterium lutimaris]
MITDHGASKRSSGDDDNMIPLINVVFLMLIFFMIAGQISKSDPLETTPPESVNDQRLTDNESIDLLVSTDGQIYVGDKLVTEDQLTEQLSLLVDAAEDVNSLSVRIKVDADLPVSELKPLLSKVREAGLVKASLITRLRSEEAS